MDKRIDLVFLKADEIEILKLNIQSLGQILKDKVYIDDFRQYKQDVNNDYLKREKMDDIRNLINECAKNTHVSIIDE